MLSVAVLTSAVSWKLAPLLPGPRVLVDLGSGSLCTTRAAHSAWDEARAESPGRWSRPGVCPRVAADLLSPLEIAYFYTKWQKQEVEAGACRLGPVLVCSIDGVYLWCSQTANGIFGEMQLRSLYIHSRPHYGFRSGCVFMSHRTAIFSDPDRGVTLCA